MVLSRLIIEFEDGLKTLCKLGGWIEPITGSTIYSYLEHTLVCSKY
jgi:hypothetical protein